MAKAKPVSPREFIRIWQTSDTVTEVSAKTGLTLNYVRFRGYYFRRHRVPLKPLTNGNYDGKYDWKELADYAKQLI